MEVTSDVLTSFVDRRKLRKVALPDRSYSQPSIAA